ncbi:hypothetical protein HLK59_32265 [Streptomyces sp. S3(2020)]|uniref:hypothetical protein n=1 Tax=Streptomyces sp. S3(2020) TaxID=2732044 RepID=UPI0014898638|nr:hypothetical protein [Streptomyces sp. S3(2020)]NNN34957.1 hypothetical protein [Streptomyces sp. S3(2020)]
MTGGTFTGHAAPCSFGFPTRLVKNADENWPTAPPVFIEVIAVLSPRIGMIPTYRRLNEPLLFTPETARRNTV